MRIEEKINRRKGVEVFPKALAKGKVEGGG